MKKVLKKFNRAISIMLVAAMVLTMAPQTAMPVLAEEPEATMDVDAPSDDSSETTTPVNEGGDNEDDPEPSDPVVEGTEGEGTVSSDEQISEGGANGEANNSEGNSDQDTTDQNNADQNPDQNAEDGTTSNEGTGEGDPTTTPDGEGSDVPTETDPETPAAMYAVHVEGGAAGTGYKVTFLADTEESNGIPQATADTNYDFKVAAETGYSILTVQYQVGDADATYETPTSMNDEANGEYYRIPGEKVTNTITIKVTVEREKYSVTRKLVVDGTEVAADQIDANGIVEFTYTVPEEDENELGAGNIFFGSKLTFAAKVKADKEAEYEIGKVAYKVGDQDEVDCTADWTGTGEIPDTAVTGDIVLTVEATKKAVEECLLAFAAHENVEKITDIKVDGEAIEAELPVEDIWSLGVKKGASVSFKITPEEDYKVDKVTAGSGDAAKEITAVDGVYTIEKLDADTSLSITTSRNQTTISVSSNTLSVTAKADNGTDVKFASGEKKWSWGEGATKLLLTVVNNNADRVPVVLYKDITHSDENVVATAKTTPTGGDSKGNYTYEIDIAKLGSRVWIYDEPIKVNYQFKDADEKNHDLENVTVSIGGKIVENDYLKTAVPVERSTEIAVKVTAKEGYLLDSVTYTGTTKQPAVKNNTTEFTVKLLSNTEIIVKTSEDYKASPLKDADDEVVASVKDIYSVSYDGKYYATVGKGLGYGDLAEITAALAVDKGDGVTDTGVVTVTDKKAVIDLSKASYDTIGGKKLILTLKAGEKEFKYTLQVSNKVAAEGDITVPAKISQPMGTKKSYKVTTKGEFGKLKVKTSDTAKEYIKDVALNDGQLEVTTGKKTAAADANVTITVYSEENKDNVIEKVIPVEITTMLPAKAPAVSLKSATDIDMTLTLSAVTDADVYGAVYYKVVATASDAAAAEKVNLNAITTKYFLKKDGKSQDVTLRVAKDNGVASDVTYGDGGACDFTVEVSLVQLDKATEEETLDTVDAGTVIEEGKDAQIFKSTKPFSTQTPAWETKLSLKKGASTIYTMQKNVQVAEAQFSKETTYRLLDTKSGKGIVEDITPNLDENEKLTVWAENGKIYASDVSESGIDGWSVSEVALGKHTIRVTTHAENGIAPAVATLTVTVVRGIDTIWVDVPSDTLQKVNGKAATIKASVIYNGDETGKDKNLQPKTKKVIWDAVKYDEDKGEYVPFEGVTVKNGTATVAKDYQVKPNPEDNTFYIRARVDNTEKAWIGAAEWDYEYGVTITDQALTPKRIDLVQYNPETGEDESILGARDAKGQYEVEASKLNNAEILVIDSKGDEMALYNLTLKSSKQKDVAVYADWEVGWVKVNKANTKATLTATANDGSKNKAELKLSVLYDPMPKDTKFGLAVYKQEEAYQDSLSELICSPSDFENGKFTYSGDTANTLAAVVQSVDNDGESDQAPLFVNYDIKVKGGKKVRQYGSTVIFTTDQETVTLELTDKSQKNNNKWTYQLTNSNFKKKLEKGESQKAKVVGSLRRNGTAAQQNVRIELELSEKLRASLENSEANKQLAASVHVDWTKLSVKNEEALYYFEEHLAKKDYLLTYIATNNTKGTAVINLQFKGDDQDENLSFTESSYPLKVTLGSKTGNTFTAGAPALKATVKVDKPKKFTFTPAGSYIVSVMDGGTVLTGKANIPTTDYEVTYKEVLNEVQKGGKENHFTDYFELTGIEDDGTPKIALSKAGLEKIGATDIETYFKNADNKKDLTGYIRYDATAKNLDYYTNDKGTGYNNLVKVKITVNGKQSKAKYAIDKTEIRNKVDAKATLTVKVNGAPVKIGAMMVDENSNKGKLAFAVNDNGTITAKMTAAQGTKAKSVTAKVHVVPADSLRLEDAKKATTLAEFKQYASSAVTVTLTLVNSRQADVDRAVARVVERINAKKVFGVASSAYYSNGAIKIFGSDPDTDIIAAMNAGKETVAQILFEELGVYMEDTDLVKLTAKLGSETIEKDVTREGHDITTKDYIVQLVEKHTNTLVGLLGEGKNTFDALEGANVTLTADFGNGNRTYTMTFEIPTSTRIEKAVNETIGKLNSMNLEGLEKISLDDKKVITVKGTDEDTTFEAINEIVKEQIIPEMFKDSDLVKGMKQTKQLVFTYKTNTVIKDRTVGSEAITEEYAKAKADEWMKQLEGVMSQNSPKTFKSLVGKTISVRATMEDGTVMVYRINFTL